MGRFSPFRKTSRWALPRISKNPWFVFSFFCARVGQRPALSTMQLCLSLVMKIFTQRVRMVNALWKNFMSNCFLMLTIFLKKGVLIWTFLWLRNVTAKLLTQNVLVSVQGQMFYLSESAQKSEFSFSQQWVSPVWFSLKDTGEVAFNARKHCFERHTATWNNFLIRVLKK